MSLLSRFGYWLWRRELKASGAAITAQAAADSFARDVRWVIETAYDSVVVRDELGDAWEARARRIVDRFSTPDTRSGAQE